MRVLRFAAAAMIALAGLSFASPRADARPQYLKAFAEKYENLAPKAKMEKCAVCHPAGEKKTVNNDYGMAMKEQLGAENVKDPKAIEDAFGEVESKASKVKDKTFGDLIKEDTLPGTNPKSADRDEE